MGEYVKTCVGDSKPAGYRGVYLMEYSGPEPYAGVPVIIDLVLKYLYNCNAEVLK
jgi:hypothetical protein